MIVKTCTKERDKVKNKSHINNTEQLKTDPQRKLKYYYENESIGRAQ